MTGSIADLGLQLDGLTLQAILAARIKASPAAPAVRYWRNSELCTDTWVELGSRVARLCSRLKSLSLVQGDTVGIFLPTSYAWSLADWACISSGYVSTVYHAAWRRSELKHALSTKAPKVILCSSALKETLVELLSESERPPVLLVLPNPDEADFDVFWGPEPSLSLPETTVSGDTVATVVFTSGTGGDAKGVELSQNALLRSAWDAYFQLGYDARGRHTLHWLPLSHLFGRVGLYIDAIAGTVAHFSRGVDRLADDIARAQVHILFAVPQMLTRLRHRIEARVRAKTKTAQYLFSLLHSLGFAIIRLPTGVSLKLQPKVRRWFFPSLHRALGGNLQVVIAGGAPVDWSDKQYFEALGISVREGYGMTETAGVAAVQPLHRASCGAGPLITGVQARIAESGELLLRGPVMLRSYLNMPAYDPDGWFHTGDIAKLSPAGNLIIEGRIKDLIIPRSGENISPAKIEAILCRHPWIGDACLAGDGRPCLVALVALSDSGQEVVRSLGYGHVNAGIHSYLQEINRDLPKFEHVHGHILAPHGFQAIEGALTVTQKKRRAALAIHFSSELDDCYARLHEQSRLRDRLEPLATA